MAEPVIPELRASKSLLLLLSKMVVDSTAVLLPERPTHVNDRSLITDRSMIRREMARARDVGLLSVMAFDSKSNYCEIIQNNVKLGNVEIKHNKKHAIKNGSASNTYTINCLVSAHPMYTWRR